MNKHHGQILEQVVRRNGQNISELSKMLHVNRRSIYNWFKEATCKPDIIFKIGCVLQHDFSIEFPELFDPEEFVKVFNKLKPVAKVDMAIEIETIDYWKNKYINLLEDYNQVLTKQSSMM